MVRFFNLYYRKYRAVIEKKTKKNSKKMNHQVTLRFVYMPELNKLKLRNVQKNIQTNIYFFRVLFF
jgi:hypothetical protein